jgi:prevent-host-death family protein
MYRRYMMSAKSAMKEARDNLSDLVNRSSYGKERIVLTRRGKGVAALVPMEDLEILERIEDHLDYEAAAEALEEKGEAIPWSKVKQTLGL